MNKVERFVGNLLMNGVGKLKLMSAREYSSQHDANWIYLRPREARVMKPPRLFPMREANGFIAVQTDFGLPPLGISEIENAGVRGESNLVTSSAEIVHHDLFDFQRDVLPEAFFRHLELNYELKSARWKSQKRSASERVGEAANFTDACSHNYAHWLTEVLPRIFLFSTRAEFKNIPIILDANIHSNFKKSVALIMGDEREIIWLAPSDIIKVDKLHLVSHAGYVPFKRLTRTNLGHAHGVFSASVIEEMVGYLKRKLGVSDNVGRRRIYIRRRSHVRHLTNAQEVEDRLVSAGFAIVEPERLTFEEQIKLFSEAEIVVGATGSALANLIFCPSNCPVIVLISNFHHTPYWYWHNMASATGNQVVHVVGQSLSPSDADPYEPDAPHADFKVDVNDIFAAIDSVWVRREAYWERY